MNALEVGLDAFEPGQLSMLAVALAGTWPLSGGGGGGGGFEADSPRARFWAELAGAAAARRGELGPGDAANLAVSFAAAHLAADRVAALGLARHCEEEPPPAVLAALLVAHAAAGLLDRAVLSGVEAHVPCMLWQTTDAVACRLALGLWLAGGRVPEELRKAVAAHVVRAARHRGGHGDAAEEAAAHLAACQGFAAVAAPALEGLAATGEAHTLRTCMRGTSILVKS